MLKPKPHYCIICKKEIFIRSSFERKTRPTCGDGDCAIAFLTLHPDKAKKVHDVMVKKELNQMKERGMSHDAWQGKLQPLVNKIARLIDNGCGCISCNNKLQNGQAKYGSHRWNVGNNNNVRFNLHNIFIGCFKCNNMLGANIDGYDSGLEQIYGTKYAEYVKFGMKRTYPVIKLTIDELKACIEIAKKVIKRLEKLDKTYSAEERITLRDDINDEIGIYTSRFDQI
jgi:hypothetical protein